MNPMNQEAITAAVQNGTLTHEQAIAVYSALFGRDPNAAPLHLPCEQCGAVTPLTHIISYKLWVPMPGPGVQGYDEHAQHYCCSHECAEAATIACLRDHLRPEAERRVASLAALPAPEMTVMNVE